MLDVGKPERARSEVRFRTRLRTGRLSDLRGRLISDCLIFDRSPRGARIKLPSDVAIPPKFIFHDEAVGASVYAQARWRRENEVGIYIPDSQLPIVR